LEACTAARDAGAREPRHIELGSTWTWSDRYSSKPSSPPKDGNGASFSHW